METVQPLLSRWNQVATALEENPSKEVFIVVVKQS